MKSKIIAVVVLFASSAIAEIKGIPRTDSDCELVGGIAKISRLLQMRGYEKEDARPELLALLSQAKDAPAYLNQAFEAAWTLARVFPEKSSEEIKELAKFACLRKAETP